MPDNPVAAAKWGLPGIGTIGSVIGGLIPGIGTIGSVIGGLLPGGGGGQITPGQLPSVGGNLLPVQEDESWWESIFGPDEPPPPQNGAVSSIPGCDPVVNVRYEQRAHCPPGYVAVRPNGPNTGQVCMLKSVAISCKLYKNPTKPPIKARDWKALKTAASVQRKLDTVIRTANKASGRKLGRVSSKR